MGAQDNFSCVLLPGKNCDDNVEPLNWERRVRIAHAVSKGIENLQDGAIPSVVHPNIKSANMLLDSSMRARMATSHLYEPATDMNYKHTFQCSSQVTQQKNEHSHTIHINNIAQGSASTLKMSSASTDFATARLESGLVIQQTLIMLATMLESLLFA